MKKLLLSFILLYALIFLSACNNNVSFTIDVADNIVDFDFRTIVEALEAESDSDFDMSRHDKFGINMGIQPNGEIESLSFGTILKIKKEFIGIGCKYGEGKMECGYDVKSVYPPSLYKEIKREPHSLTDYFLAINTIDFEKVIELATLLNNGEINALNIRFGFDFLQNDYHHADPRSQWPYIYEDGELREIPEDEKLNGVYAVLWIGELFIEDGGRRSKHIVTVVVLTDTVGKNLPPKFR